MKMQWSLRNHSCVSLSYFWSFVQITSFFFQFYCFITCVLGRHRLCIFNVFIVHVFRKSNVLHFPCVFFEVLVYGLKYYTFYNDCFRKSLSRKSSIIDSCNCVVIFAVVCINHTEKCEIVVSKTINTAKILGKYQNASIHKQNQRYHNKSKHTLANASIPKQQQAYPSKTRHAQSKATIPKQKRATTNKSKQQRTTPNKSRHIQTKAGIHKQTKHTQTNPTIRTQKQAYPNKSEHTSAQTNIPEQKQAYPSKREHTSATASIPHQKQTEAIIGKQNQKQPDTKASIPKRRRDCNPPREQTAKPPRARLGWGTSHPSLPRAAPSCDCVRASPKHLAWATWGKLNSLVETYKTFKINTTFFNNTGSMILPKLVRNSLVHLARLSDREHDQRLFLFLSKHCLSLFFFAKATGRRGRWFAPKITALILTVWASYQSLHVFWFSLPLVLAKVALFNSNWAIFGVQKYRPCEPPWYAMQKTKTKSAAATSAGHPWWSTPWLHLIVLEQCVADSRTNKRLVSHFFYSFRIKFDVWISLIFYKLLL